MGVVPEINIQKIRELIVNQYRIVYTVTDSRQIEILAVRHSARPLPEL